ncbi:hypothetical protein [Bordetella parapertussis]|nr:hypothetical protein [Bordetella parapertussis]
MRQAGKIKALAVTGARRSQALNAEIEKWQKVVEDAGIKLE